MPSVAEVHDKASKNGLTVQLCSEINAFEEEEWSVVLSDSVNSEVEICDSEYQARHHFRRVCMNIGIHMPYEAPRFETPVIQLAADPAADAAAIYYAYHGKLSQSYPGSDEAKAIQAEMLADPLFQQNARAIFALTPEKTANWIIASIRVACKRCESKAKIEQERELQGLTTYGAF